MPYCVRLALVLSLIAAPALASDPFRRPVQATVLDVLDGDTFLAEALVWPGHTVKVNVRVRGIDAPEMKARCETERAAAEEAQRSLASLLGNAPVSISNISGAKYYGRVLADVTAASGDAVAEVMLRRKLVRPYDGGRRKSWCP